MRRLSLKQCISTPGGLVAIVGANVVLLARYALDDECLDALDTACRDCERLHGRFGIFSLLEVGLPLPRSRNVQERMERLMARHTESLYAAALVFEGVGFEATMVRSSVTAVNMASRARHPSRVFSRLNEGVTWLLSYASSASSRRIAPAQSGVPEADPMIVKDMVSAVSLLRTSWSR